MFHDSSRSFFFHKLRGVRKCGPHYMLPCGLVPYFNMAVEHAIQTWPKDDKRTLPSTKYRLPQLRSVLRSMNYFWPATGPKSKSRTWVYIISLSIIGKL